MGINFQTLGMSILVLFIALIIRMVGTYVAVMGGELNVKEKIFMAFAWLPKATVQAALGPIFLDNVKALNAADFEQLGDQAEWLQMGNDILTLAVLSILITAPLISFCCDQIISLPLSKTFTADFQIFTELLPNLLLGVQNFVWHSFLLPVHHNSVTRSRTFRDIQRFNFFGF